MARKSTGTIRTPLEWPAGMPRCAAPKRAAFKVSLAQAVRELQDAIGMMGGLYPRVTFDADRPLRRKAVDQAAAVYFQTDGREVVFACDRWDRLQDNIRAIGLTLEAIRGMERWGVSDATSRAMSGFVALPPPPSWCEVLGFKPGDRFTPEMVEAAYRDLVKKVHPDGSAPDKDAFARLQIAIHEARMELEA